MSPKWKKFKGLKLQWRDKIRLNNAIWRAWYMQCKCGASLGLPGPPAGRGRRLQGPRSPAGGAALRVLPPAALCASDPSAHSQNTVPQREASLGRRRDRKTRPGPADELNTSWPSDAGSPPSGLRHEDACGLQGTHVLAAGSQCATSTVTLDAGA